jgi:hypothetical protein
MDQNWSKVKDDFIAGGFQPQIQNQPAQSGQQGLLVQIAATHSGLVTRNNGFYLPDRMRQGAASFTKDYHKPVLLHHEEHEDPIGRIVQADYVDTSGANIQDRFKDFEVKDKDGKVLGVINDQLIKDFTSNKMPYGQQVDVVRTLLRDTVLQDQGFQGLGYIRILANITQPEAVQKLMDGRYITGSVGASTNKAVCSVCRIDWTDDGPCDHKPGGIYDEAKCFIIAGDLVYDEYSFVNVPADRHSKVLQLDCNGKSTDIEVISDYSGRLHEVQLAFPQYDATNNKEEKGMAKEAKKTDGENTDVTLDIKDSTTPAPDADAPKDGDKKVADSTKPEGETTKVEDAKGDDNVEPKEEVIEDFVVRVLDSKEEVALSAEEEQKLYDFLWAEVEASVKDGELPLNEEELKDAKLSLEKRGKLPKSSFCGPARSFPVTDCAHVTAARRLITRAKVGTETKDSLLACVNRKAKSFGCSSGKTQDNSDVQDRLEHSRVLRMVLGILDEDIYFSEEPVLNDDEKGMFQTVIKRMAGLVGKDNFQAALFEQKLANEESALLEEVAKLEDTVGELRDRVDASLKEHNILFQEYEQLHDSLVEEKANTRKIKEAHLGTLVALRDEKVAESSQLTELTSEDLDAEIKRTLELVDMVKITDKLGDGLSRTPTELDLEDPTVVRDGTNKSNVADVAELQRIQEHYMFLRFKDEATAEAYLDNMRRLGKFPNDVEQIQGGSN